MSKNDDNKVLNLYPIDYPFETLVSRVKNGKLILDPHYQRAYKWDKKGYERSSKFIESCLMRIPIPACYFAENVEGNHEIIDGVQRITTICNFFDNGFPLEGLSIFTELNGKKFNELAQYQSDLENYTMRCIILRKDNDSKVIREIFARLNQGSVLLTSQEIRHAVYYGNKKFDNLLKKLAIHPRIKNFGLGKQGKKKRDGLEAQEQVLRFFAMQDDLSDYEGNLTQYLDDYMKSKEDINDNEIIQLEQHFNETLDKCLAVFEDKTFTNYSKGKQKEGLVYYDLLMWSFQHYPKSLLTEYKSQIEEKYKELCYLPEFEKAISGGLQRKTNVLERRRLWKEKLREIDGAF